MEDRVQKSFALTEAVRFILESTDISPKKVPYSRILSKLSFLLYEVLFLDECSPQSFSLFIELFKLLKLLLCNPLLIFYSTFSPPPAVSLNTI